MEEWKLINGFDYEVSNMGRVRSIDREFIIPYKDGRIAKKKYTSVILSPITNHDGYHKVSMSIIDENGKRNQKLFSVHRLVGDAFLPNSGNKPQINHINKIRNDNRVENLEWATQKENMQHAVRTGAKLGCRGNRCWNVKLTEDIVRDIRKIGKSMKQHEVAAKHGITFKNVSDVLRGKCWEWVK